jgi:TonB family protein
MSLTAQQEQLRTENRRLYPRGIIGDVVLVFFGVGKWGRLINISEGGMEFEFYEPPPSDQRISFDLKAMGREPSLSSGTLDCPSICADGQIVWTRDFERCAGVHFLDMSGAARQQIRQWLAIEPSSGAETRGGNVHRDATEAVFPHMPPTPRKWTNELTTQVQPWDADWDQSTIPRGLGGSCSHEPRALPEPVGANPQINRATIMALARWLAALAILAGITTLIVSQPVNVRVLFDRIRTPSTDNSALRRLKEPSLLTSQRVFQVEVVDANQTKRLLTFDNNASAVQAGFSSRSHTPNGTFSRADSAISAETSNPEERQSLSNLKLGRPSVPRAAMHASSEDPIPAVDFGTPGSELIHPSTASLPKSAQQVSAAPPPPEGGKIEQPRLISSVSPAYPPFAKSLRLQGDVTLDTLIDTSGRVTTMKLVSGPVLLQQAAMDALRQWKYEPARLNSQPVPMHLSVTIRFRLK